MYLSSLDIIDGVRADSSDMDHIKQTFPHI